MNTSKENRDKFAQESIDLIRTANKLHDKAQQERERIAAAFGDNGSPVRFRVSGGICEHWPDNEKDVIRSIVQEAYKATDQSFDLWRKAGRRSHTWRTQRREIFGT